MKALSCAKFCRFFQSLHKEGGRKMGSKKTSGNVTCMLTKYHFLKWSHCINLAAENGSKKTSGNVTIMLTKFQIFKMSPEHRPAESKSAKMEQKKTSVFEIFSSLTTDAHVFRKTRKKALMLVFFGQFSRFFSFFEIRKIRKKSEKYPKNRIFFIFFLCSAAVFLFSPRYTKCSQVLKNAC